MDKALFELLYTSERRDEVPAAEVGLLVERARRRNAETGVTGVLLFDGARFCQFLEGPEGAVLDPMRRIRADPRHRNVVRVHESVIGARSGARPTANTRSGSAWRTAVPHRYDAIRVSV